MKIRKPVGTLPAETMQKSLDALRALHAAIDERARDSYARPAGTPTPEPGMEQKR